MERWGGILFCRVWRHHLAYLARKAVSSVATIHEPISNQFFGCIALIANRAQKDDDTDLQIGVAGPLQMNGDRITCI